MESFQRARRSRQDRAVKPLAVPTLDEQPGELPAAGGSITCCG